VFGLDVAKFFDNVAESARKAPRHEVLIFVHGFHNPFREALTTAAALSYDLKFSADRTLEGVTILYSWPSGDKATSYVADYDHAMTSFGFLETTLSTLAASGMRLQLVAHSMGTRVLGEAINKFEDYTKDDNKRRIADNIVLAAPDVDQTRFGQISPAIRKSANRVTLYVSTRDIALGLSRELHKGDRSGQSAVCRNGMDVIDASHMDTLVENYNHSYLFDSNDLLHDLFGVIRDGKPPEMRDSLRQAANECSWAFEPR
jgi:esterase/lipase superfamily enzyme